GFSTIRTKNGRHEVQDERNDLVLVFGDWVRAFRPRNVILENVPGLVRDQRLKKLKSILDELGYTYDVRIQNAADFGVPQRRYRMILLARKDGPVVFPEPDKSYVTVRDAIGK